MRLLQEIRAAIGALDGKMVASDNKVDRNQEELQKHINSLRQAILGKSVPGRYAAVEFDERLFAPKRRVPALESRG